MNAAEDAMHDVIITAPPTPSQRNGKGADEDDGASPFRVTNRISGIPLDDLHEVGPLKGTTPGEPDDGVSIEEIEEAYEIDRRRDEARRLRARHLDARDRFRRESEGIGKVKVDPWSDLYVALPAGLIERGGGHAYELVLGGVLESLVEAEEERVGQTKKSPRAPQNLVRDIIRELPETVISTTRWRVLDALLSFADPTLERGVWPKRKKLAGRSGHAERPKSMTPHLRALERDDWIRRIPTFTHAGDHGPNVVAFGVPSSVVEALGGPAEAVKAGT